MWIVAKIGEKDGAHVDGEIEGDEDEDPFNTIELQSRVLMNVLLAKDRHCDDEQKWNHNGEDRSGGVTESMAKLNAKNVRRRDDDYAEEQGQNTMSPTAARRRSGIRMHSAGHQSRRPLRALGHRELFRCENGECNPLHAMLYTARRTAFACWRPVFALATASWAAGNPFSSSPRTLRLRHHSPRSTRLIFFHFSATSLMRCSAASLYFL